MATNSLLVYALLGGAAVYVLSRVPASMLLLAAAAALVVWGRPQAARPVPAGSIDWGVAPPDVARWARVILETPECRPHDPALVLAMLWQESGGDPSAVSPAGAWGLMQVMPSDLGGVHASHPSRAEMRTPEQQIAAGCAILSGKIAAAGGDVWRGVQRYNGTGEQSERYIRAVSALYRRLKPTGAGGTFRFQATPLDPMPSVSKPFGAPASYQTGGRHTGIDLAGPDGAPLYAVADGTVAHVGPLYLSGERTGRGPNAVVLDHGGNVYTIYSHNSAALVRRGDRVRAGQQIARQGSGGYSFGSHLHLELHVGCPFSGNWRAPFACGKFVDPMLFVPEIAR